MMRAQCWIPQYLGFEKGGPNRFHFQRIHRVWMFLFHLILRCEQCHVSFLVRRPSLASHQYWEVQGDHNARIAGNKDRKKSLGELAGLLTKLSMYWYVGYITTS